MILQPLSVPGNNALHFLRNSERTDSEFLDSPYTCAVMDEDDFFILK